MIDAILGIDIAKDTFQVELRREGQASGVTAES